MRPDSLWHRVPDIFSRLRQSRLVLYLAGMEPLAYIDRLNDHPWFKSPDVETEFLPAALEIVETPPSPARHLIAGALISFFIIAILWACFGKIDVIATASGKIVPTGRTKLIQPFETGVVHAIHVQDGQAVKKGDVLLEIDTTINEAEQKRLQQQYVEAALDAARLRAALTISGDSETEFQPPEEATPLQIETARTLLSSQLNEIRAKLDGLDQQIAKEDANRAAVDATITKLTESIPMLVKRTSMRKILADKGYGSKLDYLTTQQDLVEHQHELIVQQSRLDEAAGSAAALLQQRAQAEAEYKRTTLSDLQTAAQKAASLHEQAIEADQKYRLQTLTAPVDGTVQQLVVHTEGGVVTPAQVVMWVVPANSHLEIEATVQNHDIGFVQAGQEAAVKVDTFNYTRYGLLHGHVISVSQDATLRDKVSDKSGNKPQADLQPETSEPSGQELIYAARVALDTTQMQIDDRTVNLVPGMAVTVEIKTGKRRIIEYLLSPIAKHIHESLRER
jgi:hemolysin D